MISFTEFVEKYPNLLSLDNQSILDITTITSIYHFDVMFNIPFIADNIPLDPNFIINIKYGDNKSLTDKGLKYYRAIEGIDNKPKKRNKTINEKKYIKHGNVNKQLRVEFKHKIEFKDKSETINFKFKLFENGTIQSTGSKNIISVLFVIYNLFELLKENENYLQTGHENLNIEKLKSFNCSLINCKTQLDFKINRLNLFKLLLKMDLNMLIKFDPLRHASVNIKYNDFEKVNKKQKDITIFIFERGTILINGANSYMDLIKAYKFIMLITLKNKTEIEI